MKYLCLIYIEAARLDEAPPGECLAYADSLRQQGRCLAAEALWISRPMTTVRLQDGEISATDGPFIETKELLAGFYLLDAADLGEAIELAAKIPPLRAGRVELRPVYETENQPAT